jgi:hypothetical protein
MSSNSFLPYLLACDFSLFYVISVVKILRNKNSWTVKLFFYIGYAT